MEIAVAVGPTGLLRIAFLLEFDAVAGQKENFAGRFFVERCQDAFQKDVFIDREASVVFHREENDSRHSFGVGDFRGGEDFAGHLVGHSGDIL